MFGNGPYDSPTDARRALRCYVLSLLGSPNEMAKRYLQTLSTNNGLKKG